MTDNVQQIKEKLNVVEVISGYVRLTKAGVNYKGLCPFHNEKTPSFMVSPSRQSWHCFGCGEGGDIFTFTEKIEGVEFLEALKILAEKAGVTLERGDPKLRSEKDRLYEMCELAAEFFTTSLNNLILEYLYKRGLKDSTIEEWRLGYAPDSWESLVSFLKKKGYKDAEIEKSGLVIRSGSARIEADQRGNENYQRESANNQRQSASTRYYDRFRNRLMFPIFDVNGRVVAFSGRVMSDILPSKTEKADTGKYINSPETVLYSKSRILYGLNSAKSEIRKNNRVVLVEGQMDMLLPFQDGVKNIVATSGTALTADQLLILKRLTDNLSLSFDMDEAGFRATKRGIDLATEMGFNVSVIGLSSGNDPADFVKNNPGEFLSLVNAGEPIMKYYFNQFFKNILPQDGGIKPENKKLIAINILGEIKRLPSFIDRSNWIRELSLRIGVSESDLKEEMEQLTWSDNDSFPANAHNQHESGENLRLSASKSRKEILSERLLALLLKKTDLIAETARAASFMPRADLEFLTAFTENKGNFSDIRSAISKDARSRLDFLYLLGDYEVGKAEHGFDIGKEISFLAKEIEREHYKEALLKIGQEIKNHEARDASTDDLIKEFQNISIKLRNVETHGKKK